MENEKIEVVKVYNLIKGNERLRLFLGRKVDENGAAVIKGRDRGWRWSFMGYNIPMPVRSETWFNGFSPNEMLDWLKGVGWNLRCVVDKAGLKATVCDLPEAPEVPNTPATETDWIPVSSGQYPDEDTDVQVTYLSCQDGTPMCNYTAYRNGDNWFWTNGGLCRVTITAWRPVGEPYKGDVTDKATDHEHADDKADCYFVHSGDSEDEVESYYNFKDAKESYHSFCMGGYPDPRIYEAREIHVDF